MPVHRRVLVKGVCYHLITRGNRKQRVFLENEDFEEYLKRLKKYKKRFGFKLYGYCLMPNHVHIVGETAIPKNLSRFMHVLTLSYCLHFNRKYSKVGHLWQGRFKSKVINKDHYLAYCINYVELNPVRAKLVDMPFEYRWSSYQERTLDRPAYGLNILDCLPL